ncbi:MAG: hypothetical protein COA44_02240 [Arcobacter sp.]|nr:MAG: hypothetical protein COA44_02240 [Arcobacter sp.]
MLIVKFINSTNKHIFGSYEGLVASFKIKDGQAYIRARRFSGGEFNTSLIGTIQLSDDMLLTIETLNSTYKFEVLEGDLSNLDLSSINIDEYNRTKAIVSKPSKFFHCLIASRDVLVSGSITIVELPTSMPKMEAREYLENNVLKDSEGNVVVNILTPYFGLRDEE